LRLEAIRGIPWENIEIIHLLEEPVGHNTEVAFDKHGNLILVAKAKTIIAEKQPSQE